MPGQGEVLPWAALSKSPNVADGQGTRAAGCRRFYDEAMEGKLEKNRKWMKMEEGKAEPWRVKQEW